MVLLSFLVGEKLTKPCNTQEGIKCFWLHCHDRHRAPNQTYNWTENRTLVLKFRVLLSSHWLPFLVIGSMYITDTIMCVNCSVPQGQADPIFSGWNILVTWDVNCSLLETFLLRLSKGSGIDGLGCMSPVVTRLGYPTIKIMRPLLECNKVLTVRVIVFHSPLGQCCYS